MDKQRRQWAKRQLRRADFEILAIPESERTLDNDAYAKLIAKSAAMIGLLEEEYVHTPINIQAISANVDILIAKKRKGSSRAARGLRGVLVEIESIIKEIGEFDVLIQLRTRIKNVLGQ